MASSYNREIYMLLLTYVHFENTLMNFNVWLKTKVKFIKIAPPGSTRPPPLNNPKVGKLNFPK